MENKYDKFPQFETITLALILGFCVLGIISFIYIIFGEVQFTRQSYEASTSTAILVNSNSTDASANAELSEVGQTTYDVNTMVKSCAKYGEDLGATMYYDNNASSTLSWNHIVFVCYSITDAPIATSTQ
jgi:hypothetical protein